MLFEHIAYETSAGLVEPMNEAVGMAKDSSRAVASLTGLTYSTKNKQRFQQVIIEL